MSESDTINSKHQHASTSSHGGQMRECRRETDALPPSSSTPPSSSSSSSSTPSPLSHPVSNKSKEEKGDDVFTGQTPSSSSSSSSPSSSSVAKQPQQQGGQGVIRCSTCFKTFNNSSALAKHKLIHSDERKYACPRCKKSFKRQDHLNGHMMTHAEHKPFPCKFENCGKSYCDNRSLRRHYENHHQHQQQQKNPIAPFSLPDSVLTPGLTPLSAGHLSGEGTVFNFDNILYLGSSSSEVGGAEGAASVPPSPSTFSQLQMSPVSPAVGHHQKLQHMPDAPIFPFNEPKPVVCTDCGKRFKNTPALNGHMRLHGGYTKKQPLVEEKDRAVQADIHQASAAPSTCESKPSQYLTKQPENCSPAHKNDDSSNLSSPPIQPPSSTHSEGSSNFPSPRTSSPGADRLNQTSTKRSHVADWNLLDSSEFMTEKDEKFDFEQNEVKQESTSGLIASYLGGCEGEGTVGMFVQSDDDRRFHDVSKESTSVDLSFMKQTQQMSLCSSLQMMENSTFAKVSSLKDENVRKLPCASEELSLEDDLSMNEDQVIELLLKLQNEESAGVQGSLQKTDLTFDLIAQGLKATSSRLMDSEHDGCPSPQLNVLGDRSVLSVNPGEVPIRLCPPGSIFQPLQTTVPITLNDVSRGEDFSYSDESSHLSTDQHGVDVGPKSFTLTMFSSNQFLGNHHEAAEEPATPSSAFQQKCSLDDDREPVFLFPCGTSQVPFDVHNNNNQSFIINSNLLPKFLTQQMEGNSITLSSKGTQQNIFRFSDRRMNVLMDHEIDARPMQQQTSLNLLTSTSQFLNPNALEIPQTSTDLQLKELNRMKLDQDKKGADQMIEECLNRLKAEERQKSSQLIGSIGDIDESKNVRPQNQMQADNSMAYQILDVGGTMYLVPMSSDAFVQGTVQLQNRNILVKSKPEQIPQTYILLEDGLLNIPASNLLEVKLVCPQKIQQTFISHPPLGIHFEGEYTSHEDHRSKPSSSTSYVLDRQGLADQRSKRKVKPQPLTIPFSANNFHSQGGTLGGVKRPSSPQKSVPSPRRLKSSHSPLPATPQIYKIVRCSSGLVGSFNKSTPPQSAPPYRTDFETSTYKFDVQDDLTNLTFKVDKSNMQ